MTGLVAAGRKRMARMGGTAVVAGAYLLGAGAAGARAQVAGYWHTDGNRIVDASGATVRIAGVNWYGFETVRAAPGGLDQQDYRAVLQTIKAQGYNTVRLPLSNQMVESPGVPSSIAYWNDTGAINGDLQGLNSLQILDAIVAQAGQLGLRVILDNHRSEAGDSAEDSGLWYTGAYPESAWIADWTALASRYAGNATVVGFDLRNEPHNAAMGGACWDCGGANDWHLAAERAGDAVLAVNPQLLIVVEGTDEYDDDWYWWGGNLEGVANSPVELGTPNQLVYSAHDYGPAEYQQWWFNGTTSAASLAEVWTTHWGFIAKQGIAPVWLGEFGTTNDADGVSDGGAGSQGQWFQALVGYLSADATLNWTYWALNGEDRYGLLDAKYEPGAVSAGKQSALASIQAAANASQPTRPAAPGQLQAVAVSSSEVDLGWGASGTAGVTYSVYFGQGTPATLLASGLGGTTYSATGLRASTAYTFYVVATGSGGSSDASSQASATTQSEAGAGGCQVSYADQNDWGTGFTGGVTITTATALSSWTLQWVYTGDQQLTQAWNANGTQSGQMVTLTNASWNGAVAAGGTIRGVGFNGAYASGNPQPMAFYLNGTLCQ